MLVTLNRALVVLFSSCPSPENKIFSLLFDASFNIHFWFRYSVHISLTPLLKYLELDSDSYMTDIIRNSNKMYCTSFLIVSVQILDIEIRKEIEGRFFKTGCV